uniref:BED-type domain-containing protein n=1 Tax=Meloidogyne enterolobii TaxID=390850 RepID=A0A6V7V5V9_MELEN|nr:unnamed protein product [Meloidogyne enterolobii]
MKLANFVTCILIIINSFILLECTSKKGKGKVESTSTHGQGHDTEGYGAQGFGGQGHGYGGQGFGGHGYDAQENVEQGYGGQDIQDIPEYTVTFNENPEYHQIHAIDPLNSHILKSKRRTSSTWDHFTQIVDNKVVCKECGLKMSAYLGNLKTHLKTCWKF